MSNLPKGWKEVTLESVTNKMQSGGTPKSTNEDFYNGKIPFVKIEDITSSKKFLTKTKITINEEGLKNSSAWLVPRNSILYSMYASLGFLAINKIPVATNQAIMNIIPNSEKVDLEYLYQFLLDLKNKIDKFIDQTTQKNLNAQKVKNFLIPLPPLEEQKKIADILSIVDKKIAFVEENINATEELKKGLMQKLLTEGIGHTEFKDSELGRIPESWEVVQIKQLGTVVTGSTPKTANKEFYENGTRLWASPSDLGKSKEIKNTATKLSNLGFEQTRILPARSILVTCIGSTIGKIGIAYEEMSTNQQINSVVCNEKNNSDFYYYVLDQQKEYIKKLAGTQAVPLLNKTDFSMIKVIQAPLEEQKQIAEILSTVDKKIENLKEKKLSFEELKKGLMQKLLTGEVRV